MEPLFRVLSKRLRVDPGLVTINDMEIFYKKAQWNLDILCVCVFFLLCRQQSFIVLIYHRLVNGLCVVEGFSLHIYFD